MRNSIILAVSVAELQAANYQEGRVVSMHSVPCGSQAMKHKTKVAVLCQEYTVRSDMMDYRILRQRQNHVNLLPLHQEIWIRVNKDQMLVRGFTLHGKKIKDQLYVVVSEHRPSDMSAPQSQ